MSNQVFETFLGTSCEVKRRQLHGTRDRTKSVFAVYHSEPNGLHANVKTSVLPASKIVESVCQLPCFPGQSFGFAKHLVSRKRTDLVETRSNAVQVLKSAQRDFSNVKMSYKPTISGTTLANLEKAIVAYLANLIC